MAAYAALVSVMRIIRDIQNHPPPPISIDSQQLQSLSQILTSLQEFIEAYKSPVADADEADPLEMRIADAAEDVIEYHIMDMIHLTRNHRLHISPWKPEINEQTKSITFSQDLQRVIEEMDLIKQEAMQIDTEKAVAVYDHNVSSSVPPFRSSSSSAMVCSDAVLLGIMEKLTRGRLDRQVIPIVGMSSFLSSFLLFWNLHTLILIFQRKCRNKYNFPAEIWNMPQFRHIQIIDSYWCLPDPPSDEDDDVVIMENLHILKGVENLKCCKEVVKRIPNIKRLKIFYDGQTEGTNHDDPYCVSNIKSLCKLESLSVYCSDHKYRDAPYLHKLSFPHSLKSLFLQMYCGFEWEAVLEKIGSLPHLERLKLWGGWFRTGEWEIDEGQFSNLKYLELYTCDDLKQWKVEGSSVLPRLEKLKLNGLSELEEIPCKIGHIPTLQKIELEWCSKSAVKSAKEMVEEQVELQGESHFTVHSWCI